MTEHELTLEELSERTGVETRTLRSWVAEGLLSPPFKPGRGARYPASNADRALAIRVLKDAHGLSLSEIGRRFMMATEEQIREWALEAGPTTTPKGTAREYLSKIRANASAKAPLLRSASYVKQKPVSSSSQEPRAEMSLSRAPRMFYSAQELERNQADLASIERLILQLQEVLEAPAPRRSRGAVWTRISVTPDLELSLRGDLEPRERILFEQLADHFRAILTGGTKND